MKLLSRVIVFIFFCFLFTPIGFIQADTPAPALDRIPVADSNLSIFNYVLVEKKRVGRTDYNYTYRADMKNNGTDVKNCFAFISGTSANTTVVYDTLYFGDINEGATVTSDNTFTIRQNRRYPFDPTTLMWTISFDECQIPSLSAPTLDSPLLSGIEASIAVPVCYSGPQVLNFHLVEGPSGMSINPSSGILTWNPPLDMEGQNALVRVSVTDGINVERIEFQVPVAVSTPLQTETSGNQITVTEPGNLLGLSISFPSEIVNNTISQIEIKKLEESQTPAIPEGVIRLTDFFRVSTGIHSKDEIAITLPQISLPEGRYPFQLVLYINTDIEAAGETHKGWVPVQLDMTINSNGQVTISTHELGEASFIGIVETLTGTSSGGGTSETFDGNVCNCEPKTWSIPNLIPPHIPLFIDITDPNHQICTIEGNSDFRVDIYNFNDNNWSGTTTVNEVAYWVFQSQDSFDDLSMGYDDKVKVRVEQCDSVNPTVGPRIAGYVSPSEDRKTIHLDLDNRSKNTMKTTTFHEYFHQAQSRTTVEGLTNIMDSSIGSGRSNLAWIYEGTARWFEDYDILDNLNTYSWMSPLQQILNNRLDRDKGGSSEYRRFLFFKMLENKCSNFNLEDIINLDFTNDPTGVENLSNHLSSSEWNCDFCDGFGSENNDTLASALLFYQYVTVEENDITLIDSNEPSTFNFNTTLVATLNPSNNITSPQIGVPANGARSYRINSVNNIPNGKEVFIRIAATGSGAWVSFVENDIDSSDWIDTTNQTEYVYGQSGSAPELSVTVVNPSTENTTNVSLTVGIRDIPTDSLTVNSPSSGQNYNNRVISVSGIIPTSLSGNVAKVLIEQPNIGGSMNIAKVSGDSFSGKAVIRLGQNSISVTGLDSNNNRITSPTTVSFTGIEHTNASAVNALIKSNMVYVLQWDTNYSDLDMYVTDPSNQTIWYGNRSISGRARQDVDDVNGYGPEVTTYFTNGSAPAGNYEVNINSYSLQGAGSTHYTVDVLLNEGSNAPVAGYFYTSFPNNPLTSQNYGSGFPPTSSNSSWGADVIKVNCTGTGVNQSCSLD